MASKDTKKTETNEKPEEVKLEEDRIDEFSIAQFAFLGFKGRLPDSLVSCFLEFKRRKDALRPGRLTPEGFAMVTMIYNLLDRKEL